MSDILLKCSVCGAVLDEEDLFCPNCGTEAPTTSSPMAEEGAVKGNGEGNAATSGTPSAFRPPPSVPPPTHLITYNFICRGCGASMSYDASAQALRCPFCGSEQLEKQPDAKEIAPDGVVPFVVTRDKAIEGMRTWLGQGFWRPGDLAAQAAVVGMRRSTFPTGCSTPKRTPIGLPTVATFLLAQGNWHPETGAHEGQYAGLLVGASGALTGAETKEICPFDLSVAVPPEKVDLKNITFERFVVPRKYARPLARQGLESLEAQACQQYVVGKCRNMRVNVRITDLASRPILLPVWIMAYRYRDQVFRFLANGQTGKSTGQAPLSYRKIGAAVAIAAAIILLALLWFAALGRHNAPRWGYEPSSHPTNSAVAQCDTIELALVSSRLICSQSLSRVSRSCESCESSSIV